MNNTGLRQPDLDIVLSILDKFPNVKEAIIFGSRAKGNFRNGSDVDIALKGENINLETVSTFSYKLKVETILPYKFDVLDYQSINNSKLTEHINRKGISVYIR